MTTIQLNASIPEKIEELTLSIIEQDKCIQQLEEGIAENK